MSCPWRAQVDPAAYRVEPEAREWAGYRAHLPSCPECRTELSRWAGLEELLRTALPPARPPGEHPTEEALHAFQRSPGTLAPGQREGLRLHLQSCGTCRDELAAVGAIDRGAHAPGADRAEPVRAGLRARLAEALRPFLEALFLPARSPALAGAAVLFAAVALGALVWRFPVGSSGPSSGLTKAPPAAPEVAREPGPAPRLEVARGESPPPGPAPEPPPGQDGIGYDALGFFSEWIGRSPREPRLRAQRAALLESADLAQVAAEDRAARW